MMHFALCCYLWTGSQYDLPIGDACGVDLRTIPEQSTPGIHGSGPVFVASDAPAPRESVIRHLPVERESVEWLWDRLTAHSDPLGLDGPRPLMPTIDGDLELICGRVGKARRFRWGTPHANRVQAVLRVDFGAMWEATDGHDHCRRVLDFWCDQHRINDWRHFAPRRLWQHVPGRLLHATTVTDDFNRADENPITGWTYYYGDASSSARVVSNQLRHVELFYRHFGMYGSSLSSADHYSQITNTANNQHTSGPATRMTATSHGNRSCYWGYSQNGSFETKLCKIVSGTETQLASSGSTVSVVPVTNKQTSNGSTISFDNTTNSINLSVTDTAVTANLKAGMSGTQGSFGANADFDNWSAADLAAAGHPAMRRWGMCRGLRPVEIGRKGGMVV